MAGARITSHRKRIYNDLFGGAPPHEPLVDVEVFAHPLGIWIVPDAGDVVILAQPVDGPVALEMGKPVLVLLRVVRGERELHCLVRWTRTSDSGPMHGGTQLQAFVPTIRSKDDLIATHVDSSHDLSGLGRHLPLALVHLRISGLGFEDGHLFWGVEMGACIVRSA